MWSSKVGGAQSVPVFKHIRVVTATNYGHLRNDKKLPQQHLPCLITSIPTHQRPLLQNEARSATSAWVRAARLRQSDLRWIQQLR